MYSDGQLSPPSLWVSFNQTLPGVEGGWSGYGRLVSIRLLKSRVALCETRSDLMNSGVVGVGIKYNTEVSCTFSSLTFLNNHIELGDIVILLLILYATNLS